MENKPFSRFFVNISTTGRDSPMLPSMTTEKKHMCFRLALRSITLDDLEPL